MLMFGKRKKRKIAFLLGCLWHCIKRIDDERVFADATEFLAELCVKLGVDWKMVEDGARAYETWDAYQSGDL